MKLTKTLLLFLLCTGVSGLHSGKAQNIPNPVLPGVADAGIFQHNGMYYIGGVFTDGDFYYSKDLVRWDGPVHAVSMDNDWTRGSGAGDDQIHANHMIYLNGTFHLYWSVNYWGKDKHAVHIVHAVADDPLGPYYEPVKDTWMDNRIDPMVFKDDDGKLYMYMVRFTDGNTIWVRPMSDPGTFSGPPVYQFSSLPDTWERMDNEVAEGPWVIKYRDRYYMMYNANHTGRDWGNYQLGVAEADTPCTFGHGTKYSYPVVSSNQVPLEENYPDLLLFNGNYDPWFSYTTSVPDGKWMSPEYNDSRWEKGKGGFSSRMITGSTIRKQGTEWNTPELFLRKAFKIRKKETGNLLLRVTQNGDTEICLNGHPIYNKPGAAYESIRLSEEIKDYLQEGENILAVKTRSGRSSYLDIALFDLQQDQTDPDIIDSPGQPNILKGPNGFEWWLIYMADKNSERRSQYIDRIHFFNKTLYVEGPTAGHTPGYHPVPAKPTYGETFDESYRPENWEFKQTGWKKEQDELVSPDTPGAVALLKEIPSGTSYLYETGVKTGQEAGILAWWKNEQNWLKFGLDLKSNQWYYRLSQNGQEERKEYALPEDFRPGVYHTLHTERNGSDFYFLIDGIPAPGCPVIHTEIKEEGIPGLFAQNGVAAFDGIIYTLGWDEYDNRINGWQDKTGSSGSYTISKEGLQMQNNHCELFKGDPLLQYEYSFQVTNSGKGGKAGGYPVFIDDRNYIKAVLDYDRSLFQVTAVRDGKIIKDENFPLERLNTIYPDIKYSDFIEKIYLFPTLTSINEVWLNRQAYKNKDLFFENMFDKMSVEYLLNDRWYPLSGTVTEAPHHPGYNRLSFDPLEAEGLRFINSEAEDLERHIYKIRVNEIFKRSFNIRSVKLKDSFLIFVDGKEICRIEAPYGPAQTGLFSDGCKPLFNGIMRYHIPE